MQDWCGSMHHKTCPPEPADELRIDWYCVACSLMDVVSTWKPANANHWIQHRYEPWTMINPDPIEVVTKDQSWSWKDSWQLNWDECPHALKILTD